MAGVSLGALSRWIRQYHFNPPVKRARFRPLEDRSKIDLIAATQVKSLSLERIDVWTWKGRKTCTLEFMQYEWRSTE